MNTWLTSNGPLREIADDYNSGGGGAAEETDYFAPETTDEGVAVESQHGEQQPQSVAPAFDYEALARANAAYLQPVLQQFAPRQEQKGPSEEEFKRITKHYVPDEALAERLFAADATPAQRAAALQEYTNGIYQHLYASTGLALRAEIDPLRQSVTQVDAYRQAQQQEAFMQKTITSIPGLKAYTPLVGQAIEMLKRSGFVPQGATAKDVERHAMREVAKLVEAQVRQVNPQFSLKQPKMNGGRQGMPLMSGFTSGGGGGGGGSGSSSNWASRLLKVLG